jgi:hypothetical protein
MALFYTGSRPVTKGRNSNDAVNPYKGSAGTYSNWSLYNTSHVFDGMPNVNHVPGTGRHPHGLQMSRWYRGEDTKFPMDGVGTGNRIEGMRYRPLENKAVGSAKVFQPTYGMSVEERRARGYSFDDYSHDNRQNRLEDIGHTLRFIGAAGTAATFGRFDPHVNKGVSAQPFDDFGQPLPEGYDNPYGRNRTLEWRGIPSAKAIKI